MNLKLSLAFLFLATVSFAQPQMLDKVISVVGKNPLLLSEVEANLIQQKEKNGGLDENSRCKIFEDFLFQKLLLAPADRDSITVSDNEVDGELSRRISYYV